MCCFSVTIRCTGTQDGTTGNGMAMEAVAQKKLKLNKIVSYRHQELRIYIENKKLFIQFFFHYSGCLCNCEKVTGYAVTAHFCWMTHSYLHLPIAVWILIKICWYFKFYLWSCKIGYPTLYYVQSVQFYAFTSTKWDIKFAVDFQF